VWRLPKENVNLVVCTVYRTRIVLRHVWPKAFVSHTHSHLCYTITDFSLTKYAPKDAAAMKKKQNSELMNGRLAMMAVGGIATQSVLTGHGFPYV
jgi:hypothetical protein